MRGRADRRGLSISTGRLRPARLAAVLVVGAAYCWWATGLPGFSWSASAAIGFPAAVVIIMSARSGARAHRGAASPVRGAGLVAWTAVISALLVWELVQYRSAPRSAHPTLSAFTDQLLEPHLVRALVFAAWLAGGWLLIR